MAHRRHGKKKLRRKCDNCELKFRSHFCLLLHMKVHMRARRGWFSCGTCNKSFQKLASFVKHRTRHRRSGKSHDLFSNKKCKFNDATNESANGVHEDISGVADEEDVIATNDVVTKEIHVGVKETKIMEDLVQNKEKVLKKDTISPALKFMEQLKVLLKLNIDANDEMQDHSLQVSEVTSSGSVTRETETPIATVTLTRDEDPSDGLKLSDNGKQTEDSIDQGCTTLQEFVSANAGNGTNEESGSINEPYCGNKKTSLSENDPTSVHNSDSDIIPKRLYTCSLCSAKFISYSMLQRHKRIIHKISNRLMETAVHKSASRKESKVHQCTFCLQELSSFKSLNRHMKEVHKCNRNIPKNFLQRPSFCTDKANLLAQDTVDLAVNCLGTSFFQNRNEEGLLKCSLCDASFLTYGGQKNHLKTKHNIGIVNTVTKKHASEDTTSKDGNKRPNKDVPNFARYVDDKMNPSMSKDCGYDSDVEISCKKCHSNFGSVIQRRKHALESHGLKVSYQGEEFIFSEFKMKRNEGSSSNITDNGVPRWPIIDTKEKFYNIENKSCKLCCAKYQLFASLQRHMLRKHNVKAVRQLNLIKLNGIRVSVQLGSSGDVDDSKDSASKQILKGEDLLKQSGKSAKPNKGLDQFSLKDSIQSSTLNESSKKTLSLNNCIEKVAVVKDLEEQSKQADKQSASQGSNQFGKQPPCHDNPLPKSSKVTKRVPDPVYLEQEMLSNYAQHTSSDKVIISKIATPAKARSDHVVAPSNETTKDDTQLWISDFRRKKFTCLICDSHFSGYFIQRRHMKECHKILLDQRGNIVVNTAPMQDSTCEKLEEVAKPVEVTPPRSNNVRFSSVSNGLSNSVESEDIGISNMANDADVTPKTTTVMSIEKNKRGRYECPKCPLDFANLIDRHIHVVDIHIKGQHEVPETISRPNASPDIVASKLEACSPTGSLVNKSTSHEMSNKRKTETSKPNSARKQRGSGEFVCKICRNRYMYLRGLSRHMKYVHKKKNSDIRTSSVSSDSAVGTPTRSPQVERESQSSEGQSNECQDLQSSKVLSNLLAITINDDQDSSQTGDVFDNGGNGTERCFSPVPPYDEAELDISEENVFCKLTTSLKLHDPESNSMSNGEKAGWQKNEGRLVIETAKMKQDEAMDYQQIRASGSADNKFCMEVNTLELSDDEDRVIDCVSPVEKTLEPMAVDEDDDEQESELATHELKCGTCSIEMSNAEEMRLHRLRLKHFAGFVCTIPGCGKSFSSRYSHANHTKATCKLCHKKLSTNYCVKRHLQHVHKISVVLTCDICGEQFPEPISLALHNKEIHMINEVDC